MMKFEVEFFNELYLKAKLSFKECILNPDNDYLKDEINIQINEITLIEDSIHLEFSKHEIDKFVIEVKLQLISPDNHLLGKYSYYEDEKEIPLDDNLVFY